MAYHQMSEEESLKRSHSKFSNFKLTLVCLLCAFSVSLFMAALGTLGTTVFSSAVTVIGLVVGGVLTALSLLLISRFKR